MSEFVPLTQAQLEQFPKEFALFLASLGIDKEHWEKIKKEDSDRLHEILRSFSAVVWTEILSSAKYLEHKMVDGVALYSCGEKQIQLIYIRSEVIDWSAPDWFERLMVQLDVSTTSIRTGQKAYASSRIAEMYALLLKGAEVCSGEIYDQLSKLLDSKSPS
ncbi:MAG: DUF6495 family protein [Flavobacteriaceae bacterium]